MKRTFVFGDIHGCCKTLQELLQKISPDPGRDALVFLGDYINRGPDSMPVVSELIRLRKEFAYFVALMGNHEQMWLNYLEGGDREFFLAMGGGQTLRSYGLADSPAESHRRLIPPDHLDFFSDLLTYWEDEQYIYVHAGLQPEVHLTLQSTDWLLWARESFIESDHDFGKRVVFGHTPFQTPRIEANKIGIDTGAVYGGHLTCLILPDMEFVSVERENW